MVQRATSVTVLVKSGVNAGHPEAYVSPEVGAGTVVRIWHSSVVVSPMVACWVSLHSREYVVYLQSAGIAQHTTPLGSSPRYPPRLQLSGYTSLVAGSRG